jgi:hypothetical protein
VSIVAEKKKRPAPRAGRPSAGAADPFPTDPQADPRLGLERALRFCTLDRSPRTARLRAALAQGLHLLEGTVRAADRIRALLDEADALLTDDMAEAGTSNPVTAAPARDSSSETPGAEIAPRARRYGALLTEIDDWAREAPPGTPGPSLLTRSNERPPEVVLDRDGQLRHVLRRVALDCTALALPDAAAAFEGPEARKEARAAISAARNATDRAADEFCKDAAMIADRLSDLVMPGAAPGGKAR